MWQVGCAWFGAGHEMPSEGSWKCSKGAFAIVMGSISAASNSDTYNALSPSCMLCISLAVHLCVPAAAVVFPLPAEHIQKQIERGYAEKDAQLTFWPTNLGESLISSYRWAADLWLIHCTCCADWLNP
jgi:hypothetical protein